jgi:hypothetical protein
MLGNTFSASSFVSKLEMWGRNGLVSSKKLSWRCRNLMVLGALSLLSNASFLFVPVPARSHMMHARIRHDIEEEQDRNAFPSFING